MKRSKLENLTPPGLNPMKQVELYMKWRKFVPIALQDEVCPRPPEHIMKKVRELRKDKRNAKEDARNKTNKKGKRTG